MNANALPSIFTIEIGGTPTLTFEAQNLRGQPSDGLMQVYLVKLDGGETDEQPGILAALRAVQHSLHSHDRKLSPAHEKVISDWWAKTSIRNHPDLQFIKDARDQMLKAGSFPSFATNTESGIGEGSNYKITRTEYDLAYYEAPGATRSPRGNRICAELVRSGADRDRI